MAATAVIKPPFTIGSKEVFLPTFGITLHRNGFLGPKFATFTVPLWFSKLDIRDYLYNVYNVRILSVRSYVKLQPMSNGLDIRIPGETYARPQQGRQRRLKSIKRMTVELERPFAWPEEPENLDPWQKEQFKAVEKQQEEFSQRMSVLPDAYVDKKQNASIKEQAKALLDGKKRWTPPENMRPGPVISR